MARKTPPQRNEKDVAPSLRALHAVMDIPPESYGEGHWRTRRDVLQIIAKHANPDGTNSYPALGTIARYARLEERQARRVIEWFKNEEREWLTVKRNKSPLQTNLYTIVLDRLPKSGDFGSDSRVSDQEPPDRTVQGSRSDSAGCLIGQCTAPIGQCGVFDRTVRCPPTVLPSLDRKETEREKPVLETNALSLSEKSRIDKSAGMARQLQKQEPAAPGGQAPASVQKADEAAALQDLIVTLVRVSNREVLFDRQQQRGIDALRKKYSDPEIVAAFREFYDGLEKGNQFLLTHAPKRFIDVACQWIDSYRLDESARQSIKAQVAAAEALRCAERDAEFERIRLAEAEEAELMEDSLPV